MAIMAERATVKLKNNEMDYFTFGRGEKIFVMLPGLSVKSILNNAEGVASAYRMFSDEFTVYCFDRTKFLSKNYTIEQLAEDTAEAMTALGLKNVCLFGASQGGMIAMYIAARHPELVGKLLLASTCARLNPTAEKVMKTWVALAEKCDINAFCDSFIDVLYSKEFAEMFGRFIRLAHKDVTQEDFNRFIILGKSCDTLSVYDELDKIRCPVLVIGAKADRVLTAEGSVEIAEKLGGNCELYMYDEKYGHCVFDEAPDYKDRIYKFFS